MAAERGRSDVGWAVLVAFVSVAGYLLGFLVLAVAFQHDDEGGVTVLASFAPSTCAFGLMLGVVTLLYVLPTEASAAGLSWPVYRPGQGDQAGADGRLSLQPDGVH